MYLNLVGQPITGHIVYTIFFVSFQGLYVLFYILVKVKDFLMVKDKKKKKK